MLGHLQRGGSPTNFDRALCTIFGAKAVELIAAGEFGKMVAYQGSQVTAVTISEAVGQLKTVPPDGRLRPHGWRASGCVSAIRTPNVRPATLDLAIATGRTKSRGSEGLP